MEGFLSLEQAAEQLQFSVTELARQIEEGRVVAIIKEGHSWLSAGEVSRLKRQSERPAVQPEVSAPEELRLLRRFSSDAPKSVAAVTTTSLELEEGRPTDSEPPSLELTLTPSMESTEQSAKVDVSKPASEEALPSKTEPSQEEKGLQPELSSKASEGEKKAEPELLPEPQELSFEPAQELSIPVPSPPSKAEDKMVRQIQELNKRCAELESRNLDLETTANRLKSGLQETEATLKRNRAARANLENDVIGLQDQLAKARARNEALEREVQRLGAELERAEDAHNTEIRRFRSNKGDRSPDEREAPTATAASQVELEALRAQMSEKDRLLAQEYEQRAVLRSQLEDQQQKYFELKARYDKEKTEWSELMAQAVQNQRQLRDQLEELRAKSHPKGWNPFRREK